MSNLEEQAKKLGINLNQSMSAAERVRLYKSTLAAIDVLLDTKDSRVLSQSALTILIRDILEVIEGMRGISKRDLGKGGSVDGVLTNLRMARDELYVASTILKNGGQVRSVRHNPPGRGTGWFHPSTDSGEHACPRRCPRTAVWA